MLTDMLVDFLVLVSIVILCIIGIVNTDKLDLLVSSSGQKKNRYLGVASRKRWVAVLYGVTHFLILFGGWAVLMYFVMISWVMPTFMDWFFQNAGFHDGRYVPFWPYLLLMVPCFFFSILGISMLHYSLVWVVKRLLLRSGFLEWKVFSVRTVLPDPEKTGEQLGSWVLSYFGVKYK